jgi:polyisoprenyl-phosphate glycosyltransferase
MPDLQLRDSRSITDRKFVSIVIPFFNEATGVDTLYAALEPIINSVTEIDWELVCIDDGSTDDTLDNLKRLISIDPRVQVVELSRNFGKEAALTAGIDAAMGDAVILFDADLQDPPGLIPRLISEWRKGYEVVIAERVDRSSDSFFKRVTAALFYKIHNLVSQTKIPENVGDFRLMDRIVVNAIRQLDERQRFMKGLFAWVGFRNSRVQYTRRPRATGMTKFTGWSLWNFALEGLTSFTTIPLRIWTYAGVFCAFMSITYATWIAVRTMIFGVAVPGYASIMVAILFFAGLQLLSVGLLGEYIGRIYLETKRRPTYIVRQVHAGKVRQLGADSRNKVTLPPICPHT